VLIHRSSAEVKQTRMYTSNTPSVLVPYYLISQAQRKFYLYTQLIAAVYPNPDSWNIGKCNAGEVGSVQYLDEPVWYKPRSCVVGNSMRSLDLFLQLT
jgi:hypothetical protein